MGREGEGGVIMSDSREKVGQRERLREGWIERRREGESGREG